MKSTNNDFEEARLNFKVAKILYQNMSPINICLIIISYLITIAVAILCFISMAHFILFKPFISNSSEIDLIFLLCLELIVSICVYIICCLRSNPEPNKEVSNKRLVKMITKIKQCGLSKHFLKSDLFIPISNPSKPILYSDVENIYLKAKKEFELQNSLNNQKEIIHQCLD